MQDIFEHRFRVIHTFQDLTYFIAAAPFSSSSLHFFSTMSLKSILFSEDPRDPAPRSLAVEVTSGGSN